MNKKFMRIISVILSVMMIFSCVITASAEETPSTERIKVTVRVEGLSKQLAKVTVFADKSSTVKEIVDAASVKAVYDDSLDIVSVKDEAEKSTSQWQYAVNGAIKTAAIDTVTIEGDAEIVLFNATSDAVMPSINAEDVELTGVITITGTDKNGASAPVADATVTWKINTTVKSFVTDAAGKIYLAEADITSGKHDITVSKVNQYNVPVVVRLDEGAEVDVPEFEEGEVTEKTLFEQVYDFLYSIFKGIIEVWVFYITAIGGLFGGENAN